MIERSVSSMNFPRKPIAAALGSLTTGSNPPRFNGARSASLPKMVSGYGQYHTNEADPAKPEKKLTPYVGIDLAGIRALVDNPHNVDKAQGQWLIPSTLQSRTFDKQAQDGQFWLLWADLDTDPKPISEVDSILRQMVIAGFDFELYASRSAKRDYQKARILIPILEPLSGVDWQTCQDVLHDKLAALGILPDKAAQRPGQLCYLPNRGEFYDSRSVRGGKHFDPMTAWADEIAAKRRAIEDARKALQVATKAAAERRQALKLTDAPNAIGPFNHAYTVQEILTRAGYAQRGDTFRHPHSESGSFSASVRDGRVHSWSSSDPLYTGGGGIGAHDAFSAFTVLFADGNRNKALELAGDDWLAIDGESWNKVKRREYMQQEGQAGNDAPRGEAEPGDGNPAGGDSDPVAVLSQSILTLDAAYPAETALPHFVGMWIPHDEVTLLAGHGGGGKSYVALSIAVHVALGLDFGPLPTAQAGVLFFSGEDGAHVLRLRLAKLCRALKIDPLALNGKLHLLDASDIDPALHREQRSSTGGRQQIVTETALLAALSGLTQSLGVGLVIVDNASDAYDDNEIVRARVRSFIRSLRTRIARPGRAVLLLAHINKASAKERTNAEDYSGSTAWHNSVRSRLSLITAGEDAMTIEHAKANLGPKAKPVRMEWHEGVPLVSGSYCNAGAEAAASIVKAAERARDIEAKAALVGLVREFDKRGERVPAAVQGPATTYKLLSACDAYPKGVGRDKLSRLLRELETEGCIFRRWIRTPDRKPREVFTCAAKVEESAPIQEGLAGQAADVQGGAENA